MSKKKKVGVYGGTFSPPHIGHVSAAIAFIEQEKLDELIIIPTYQPPHKEREKGATPMQRLEMCKLSFSHVKGVSVSDMEIERKGKSYTYLTLSELISERNDIRPVFLCGTDMILTFDEWYRFEDIFKMADIVYIRRENDELITEQIKSKTQEYVSKYNANVRELRTEPINISSTELREMIRKNQNTSAYLNKETEEYIRKWNIYQTK